MTADIILTEITGYIQNTSTSSKTIGTGSFSFTMASNIKFIAGMAITADAGSNNIMTGTVTSYNATTLTLVLNIISVTGSGTFASWTIGGTNVFRYCSTPADKIGGFRTGVSETPAMAVYLPRLVNPGNLSRSLFPDGATYGDATIGYGNVVLENSDGLLDNMIDYGYDGQPLVVRKGTTTSSYPLGFSMLFSGTMEQVEFSWNQIIILLRDNLALAYNKPLQSLRFAGTGTVGTSIEGDINLKGKPKPIGYGQCYNVPATLVDAVNYIYLLNTLQCNTIDAVYNQGVALTLGTARASIAALQAGTPAAGAYDYYLGASGDGCYIKLATTVTVNTITVDFTQGANAAARTIAQIVKQIYVIAGVTISAASVTALDTLQAAPLGYYNATEEKTIRNALDEITASAGVSDYPNRAGIVQLARMDLPTGTAVATFKPWQIIDNGSGIQRIKSSDTTNGIPVYQVLFNWQKNYSPQQDSDLASSVSASRRLFVNNEFRTVISTDLTIKVLHPLSEVLTFNSLFISSSDAQTESDRRLTIYKTRRDVLQITIASTYTNTIELNDVIQITAPRFTWAAGKKFRVLGISEDYATLLTTLTVWG